MIALIVLIHVVRELEKTHDKYKQYIIVIIGGERNLTLNHMQPASLCEV